MKNLVWILMLAFICSCSSNSSFTDEPNGGRTADDSIAADDSTVIEAEPLTAELRPVLTLGKKWIVIRQNPWEQSKSCSRITPYEITYEVIGDTLAFGKNCKIVHATNGKLSENIVWYEENGKVYDVNLGFDKNNQLNNILTLAYTFYPESSDETDRYSILSKGTVVCLGKTRRAVKTYTKYSPDHADYYVEGIGSLRGSCLQYSMEMPSCPVPRCYILQQCYDGDELIYDIKDFSPEKYKEEVRFIEDYDKYFNL